MTEEVETVGQPVLAHATPVPDQLWAGLRQIVPPIVAFAVGRGWLASDLAVLLGVVGGVMYPIVLGQLKTRLRAKQLATVASSPKVPDSVAAIK